MAHRLLSEIAVSISEHKQNPMATVAAFTCVPAKAYEELIDLVEDLELTRIADARLADGQEPVQVSLDALCSGLSSGSSAGVAGAVGLDPGAVQENIGRTADRAPDPGQKTERINWSLQDPASRCRLPAGLCGA